MSEEMLLASGTTLGSYRIERALGQGGMGAVYVATHTGLDKKVALKTLHASFARHADVVRRFLQEGRAASRIRHPHVVDVSDVGQHDGRPYLVMELLDGEDLAHLIEREGPLDPERALKILLPVMAAVGAAHDAGVVHRDLKPENVFLARQRDRGLHPKVLDFGISKLVDDAEQRARTGTGTLLGTPYYMAPEQARGSRDVDARADQYALGAILYECLSAKRPVDGDTFYALLHAIVAGEIAPLSSARPELSTALIEATHRALSAQREDRFPDVRAFGRALVPHADPIDRAQWREVFGELEVATLVDQPAGAVASAARLETASANAGTRAAAPHAATLDPRESLARRSAPGTTRVPTLARLLAGGVAAALVMGGIGGAMIAARGAPPVASGRPIFAASAIEAIDAGEVIAVDAGVDTGSDAGTDARVDGSRDRGAARRGRRGQAHVPDRGGSEEYDVE